MSIVYGMLTIAVSTAINNFINLVICDTSTVAITVTLPAAPEDGLMLFIKDLGNASVNNITVDGNGKNIDTAATKVLNTNYATAQLLFCSTNDLWLIL